MIDTGFTEYLSLPPDAVEHPRLPFARYASFLIAGDLEVEFPTHLAFVEFDGETFETEVLNQDGDPLVGMALLTGFEFR